MDTGKSPRRDDRGRTVWVTRSCPNIDRIACPWLIRRFVDQNAVFLSVVSAEITAVNERFNATSFDIERVYWTVVAITTTLLPPYPATQPPMFRQSRCLEPGTDLGSAR